MENQNLDQSGIYKITNLINGQCYIGQSINIKKRWQEHRRYKSKEPNTNKLLYKAFDEFGLDNFSFEVLEYCEKNLLNEKEQYYIDYFNSIEDGYNMKLGGNFNNTISDETVDKIIELLQDSNFTQREIAIQTKVSKTFVNHISQGILRKRDNIVYPIRKKEPRHINHCIDCGKEILPRHERCLECENQRRRDNSIVNDKISREELKQLIRTKSFCEIGRQYNVSDNAIRKWCVHYKLPRTKKIINSYSDKEWNLI